MQLTAPLVTCMCLVFWSSNVIWTRVERRQRVADANRYVRTQQLHCTMQRTQIGTLTNESRALYKTTPINTTPHLPRKKHPPNTYYIHQCSYMYLDIVSKSGGNSSHIAEDNSVDSLDGKVEFVLQSGTPKDSFVVVASTWLESRGVSSDQGIVPWLLISGSGGSCNRSGAS